MTQLVNLYLYDDMQFSDVNFNIGGREFLAHKNILAARCKYFAAMFQHPMKEQSTNQVKIEDIEPEVFDHLHGACTFGQVGDDGGWPIYICRQIFNGRTENEM